MKSEVEWVKGLVQTLDRCLAENNDAISVVAGFRLAYAMEVRCYNDDGEPDMAPMKYQTDILVREKLNGRNWIPRVVIEAKYGSVTSHDAITYSQKAIAHRNVHPFLRYGFLIGANKEVSLPGRLLRHGATFDFMLSWPNEDPSSEELQGLVSVLNMEVEASRKIESVVFDTRAKNKPKHTFWHRSLVVGDAKILNTADLQVFYPDADLESADWTKQSWDLPPYKSPEFLSLFPDLDNFRRLPAYMHAVRNGLIVNDEWCGR